MLADAATETTTILDPTTCNVTNGAVNSLRQSGWWMGYITDVPNGPYTCDNATKIYRLYSGNYLNFRTWLDEGHAPTTGATLSKLEIAKTVLSELLAGTDDNLVRFGLMVYRGGNQAGQGGQILAPVGSSDSQIMSALNNATDQVSDLVGHTPLAECLAEAGLYFAGKDSWSNNNDSVRYTSPVQWRCQKNYVIILTDGLSTSDEGVNNRQQDIIHNRDKNGNSMPQYFGKAIGNYDHDTFSDGTSVDPSTNDQGGTHWLDDVAKFLYEEDLIKGRTDSASESFDDEYFPKQFISTFAIGFGSGTDFSFLGRVTDDTHGRGKYYSTTNGAGLSLALQDAVGTIIAANSSFIAPVVPVNRLNKVYSGNSVYLSLFKPDATESFWRGNIKKFGLSDSGELLQKDGTPAADAGGQIVSTASSAWTYSSGDGSVVEEGGAGAVVLNQSTRHFYTYNGTVRDLTDGANAFSAANADVLAAVGGSDMEAADLVNWLTARGDYALNGASKRVWVLGDFLHSKPATMFYENSTILFAGSNDGFLHVFADDDGGYPNDLSKHTLSESWCFVPPELLPRLHELRDSSTHPYFIDGTPVLFDLGSYRYLTFGLRRGGDKYYTLRVGGIDESNYTAPYYAWDVGPDKLQGYGNETLGQSWCRPWVSTIRDTSGTNKRVLLFAGGYDAANQDLDSPASSDTKGRAIFAVDAATGALQTTLNFNHGNYPSMTNCFVELVAFDRNGDGLDDTIYSGSLGGDLFGFSDRNKNGTWSMVKVFQARSGDTANMLLKFLYEPDVALETFGDYIYIGTGDREHPSETATVNRLYAIKNTWASSWTTLTEADLVDVTEYNYTSPVFAGLQSGNGWFIKLNEQAGEKVVSSPLVYNGIVFFTTYTPGTGNSSDKCSVEGLGGGRLYALNYLTGEAIPNLFNNEDSSQLGREDRYRELGVGIPSPPTLVITASGGAKLIIGTGGAGGTTGAETIEIPSTSSAKIYYWKQD